MLKIFKFRKCETTDFRGLKAVGKEADQKGQSLFVSVMPDLIVAQRKIPVDLHFPHSKI